MKVLSLFDGISCARVALNRAGIPVEVYYASEIDKNAEQISHKNYPDIIRVGNVKNVFRDKVGKIDLLIGGSPCQDLSIAKQNRKGLNGERSGLFWEYVRVLNEVKPKYFILENVASMPKEAKQIITETLGVEPIMINAALVSAQSRKRLFWTDIPGVVLPEDREIFLKDIIEQEVDEKYYIKDETLSKILEKMRQGKPIAQAFRIHNTEGKSVTLSSGGGGTGAKTGLYCLNPNGSVIDIYNKKIKNDGKAKTLGTNPQCMSAIAGQALIVVNPNGTEKSKSNTIRTSGRGSKFGDKHNWDQIAIVGKARGKNVGYQSSGKTPTLTGSSWQYNNFLKLYEKGNLYVRRLTPMECDRLQSLPDNYTEGISDSGRYKALGNAFNVEVITHILKSLCKPSNNA